MATNLKYIAVINRAPFEKFELDTNEENILVLSAVNGKGKTTLISYIVDAFYEMARKGYPTEFTGRENKYYRVSSDIYTINKNEPSIVYIRFSTSMGQLDYLDMRGICSSEKYEQLIKLENKIPYGDFSGKETPKVIKYLSKTFTPEKLQAIFESDTLIYFPSYRYEVPGFINDPYKVNLEFTKKSEFVGYLNNPIEVYNSLERIAGWFMDVALDIQYYTNKNEAVRTSLSKKGIQDDIEYRFKGSAIYNTILNIINAGLTGSSTLYLNICKILTEALSAKEDQPLRFGIGKRNSGASRISIVKAGTGEVVCPSIFSLSAGETSVLCMFGEILRQADKLHHEVDLGDITGIVLIDEVEKNLHIKLQKEVIPVLLSLFPKVQFIISSHSPFLQMGLADTCSDRSIIVDVANGGLIKNPSADELYSEVYEMMVKENDRFKNQYTSLKEEIDRASVPLIITEGSTDWKHMKHAFNRLKNIAEYKDQYSSMIFEFYEYEADNHTKSSKNDKIQMSGSELCTMCANFSKLRQNRTIIFVGDNDVPNDVKNLKSDVSNFKSWGNNVFSFVLPVPDHRRETPNICIEHYYLDDEIRTELEVDGIKRRIFIGKEFDGCGRGIDAARGRLCLKRDKCGHGKIDIIDGAKDSKVVDNTTGEDDSQTNYALPKSTFADAIYSDVEGFANFNVEQFHKIFLIINEIILDCKEQQKERNFTLM